LVYIQGKRLCKVLFALYNDDVKSRGQENSKKSLILLAGPAVSLAITPFLTFDVLTPPKLMALTIFGGIGLGTIIVNRRKLTSKKFKPLFFLSIFFLLALISSLFLSGSNLVTQLYGVHGRHTGLIAYFSLTFILISIVLKASMSNVKFGVQLFIATGAFSYFYGYLQVLKLDPLPWSRDSWVVGTFANPNFFSSFIGLTLVLAIAYLLNKSLRNKFRLYGIVSVALGLILLARIGSTQGFIVLFVGSSFVFLTKLYTSSKFSRIFYPFLVLFLVCLILLVLDIFQKAPWSSKLYKMSVSARGDYWRAALEIMKDEPWTGVGIDQFRNWYPRYRDLNSLNHGESLTLADASHNIFLDFGVSGGVFLFVAYVSLVILTLVASVRLIKRMQKFQPEVVGIIGVWLGYQVQSVISINQFPIAIWGWIMSGLIIGLEISDRPSGNIEPEQDNYEVSKKRMVRKPKNRKATAESIYPFIGAVVGICLVWPLISAHINYNSALKSANPLLLIKAANQFPKEALRMSMAAESVSLMGFPRDGYELAKKASDFDPNFSIPWKVMATFPRISEVEKELIQNKINLLDPYFNETERRRLALK
jgi:O-antigen ligase